MTAFILRGPDRIGATKDSCSSLKLQLPRFFASLRMTAFILRSPDRIGATKDLCSSLKLQLPRFFASLRMTAFRGFSVPCLGQHRALSSLDRIPRII